MDRGPWIQLRVDRQRRFLRRRRRAPVHDEQGDRDQRQHERRPRNHRAAAEPQLRSSSQPAGTQAPPAKHAPDRGGDQRDRRQREDDDPHHVVGRALVRRCSASETTRASGRRGAVRRRRRGRELDRAGGRQLPDCRRCRVEHATATGADRNSCQRAVRRPGRVPRPVEPKAIGHHHQEPLLIGQRQLDPEEPGVRVRFVPQGGDRAKVLRTGDDRDTNREALPSGRLQEPAQLDLLVHRQTCVRAREQVLVDQHVAAGVTVGPRDRRALDRQRADTEARPTPSAWIARSARACQRRPTGMEQTRSRLSNSERSLAARQQRERALGAWREDVVGAFEDEDELVDAVVDGVGDRGVLELG